MTDNCTNSTNTDQARKRQSVRDEMRVAGKNSPVHPLHPHHPRYPHNPHHPHPGKETTSSTGSTSTDQPEPKVEITEETTSSTGSNSTDVLEPMVLAVEDTTNTDSTDYPVVKITNNLSFDIDIYDEFGDDPNKVYTKLGTVSASSSKEITTIHSISWLIAARSGEISAFNNNYYNQFPVAVFVIDATAAANYELADDPDPIPFTATTDDQEGMEQSFKFLKITANPDTTIAKNFQNVLSNATADTMDDDVNNFFKEQEYYSKATLQSWTQINYWKDYQISAWQGPYYLYSVPDSSSSTSSSTSSDVYLVATVQISSSASGDTATLTMAGTLPVQTESLVLTPGTAPTDSNSNGTSATIGDGGGGEICASLTPAWTEVYVIQATQGLTAQYLIGSCLSGTVNGTKVFGTQAKQNLDSSSDGFSQYASDFFDWIESHIGTIISAGMLYFMYASYKRESDKEKAEAKNDEQKQEANNNLDEELQQAQPRNEELQQDAQQRSESEDELQQSFNTQRREALTDAAEKQFDAIDNETLLSAPDEDIENVFETTVKTIKTLNSDQDLSDEQLDQISQTLNINQVSLDQVVKDASEKVTAQEYQDMTNAKDAADENLKQEQEIKNEQEKQQEAKEESDKNEETGDEDDFDPLVE